MRILVLAPHPFFTNRGTPIAVRMLIEGLCERGHEVTVLTFHEGEPVDIPGCTVERIPAPPGVRGLRPGFSVKKLICDALLAVRCRALVASGRYDLVHAVEEAAFIALAMKVMYGVPYVYDMDSSLAQQMQEKYPVLGAVAGTLEWFEAGAVRGSEAVLAVCRSLAETAAAHAPGKRIARLEDVSLLAPVAPDRESLAETVGAPGPYVMYVGNLERYQGIDLLVDAFALAAPRVPEARLVVIGGEAADIERYAARAAELGVGERTHLIGPRPVERLADYLDQAAVLASPRVQGVNTAMKVYSYLDSGRPVLATRLPTHTQVLDDDIACLVEPTPAAMAEGLVRLLADETVRRELAGAARRRVAEEYSPEAFRRKLGRFYEPLERAFGTAS